MLPDPARPDLAMPELLLTERFALQVVREVLAVRPG